MLQAGEEGIDVFEIDRISIAIPARRFKIKATLAYDQSVPLVDEFILRFLRLGGDVSTTTLREFFGFSDRELYVTLIDLSERGLVEIRDDSVMLAARGKAAFLSRDDDEPRIVAVQETDINVAFEQVASTPLQKTPYRQLSPRGVITLQFDDRERAARPSEEAIQSFKTYFAEIADGYLPRRQDLKRAYVYSVDDVRPKAGFRHELSLPIVLSTKDKPRAFVDFGKLLDLRPRGSRDRLVALLSELIQTLDVPELDVREGFDFISEFDCGAMSKLFITEAAYADDLLEWLHRSETAAASESFSETIEFVGSPALSEVRDLLIDRTRIQEKDIAEASKSIFWFKPNLPGWGRSSAFRESIDRFASIWGDDASRILLIPNGDIVEPRDLKRAFGANTDMPNAFDCAMRLDRRVIPDVLELIYRPGSWIVVALYLPITENGPRVPVGLFSSAPEIVFAAGNAIKRRVLPISRQSRYLWSIGSLTNDDMNDLLSKMLH